MKVKATTRIKKITIGEDGQQLTFIGLQFSGDQLRDISHLPRTLEAVEISIDYPEPLPELPLKDTEQGENTDEPEKAFDPDPETTN